VTTQLAMTLTERPPEPGHWNRFGSRARVYDMLSSHYPQWVPLPRLVEVASTKVTARISDLREYLRPLGWTVENELDRTSGRSWYRLAKREAHDGQA